MQLEWSANDQGGFTAKVGDVSLHAQPVRLARGLTPKPARGTEWRAFVTHWCERTSTATRYGRDVYSDLQPDRNAAMLLAEQVFGERNGSL